MTSWLTYVLMTNVFSWQVISVLIFTALHISKYFQLLFPLSWEHKSNCGAHKREQIKRGHLPLTGPQYS